MIEHPLLYYFGGKWRLADWIISYFPAHRCFVDVFGGGANILLKKERSCKEIYNDINHEVVNLMAVVRDRWEELQHKLKYTLWSKEELLKAQKEPMPTDPIEMARRTIIISWMSRGMGGTGHSGGFRNSSIYSYLPTEKTFPSVVDHLEEYAKRMRGVVIENVDAVKLIEKYKDNKDVLLYVDPPYVHDTRRSDSRYEFEYTQDDHKKLLGTLCTAKCSIVLSGYDSILYTQMLGNWHKETRIAKTSSGHLDATECLWMNFQPENVWFSA